MKLIQFKFLKKKKLFIYSNFIKIFEFVQNKFEVSLKKKKFFNNRNLILNQTVLCSSKKIK